MKIELVSVLLLGSYVGAAVIRQEGASPCAAVGAAASSYQALNPDATPRVDAQLAYDCLTSVELIPADATALVEAMFPYLEWQSDTSYLKSPPASYQMPAVDIFTDLNTILANIKVGMYKNEHEFQTDLFTTFQAVHDGHFRFAPDLLSKALQFRRPVQVVSVSRDGVELPKVYLRDDISAYVASSNGSMPSAVLKVNGDELEDFMAKLAQLGFLQDPDALYNNLFYEMAFDAQSASQRYAGYFALAGRYGYLYPGASTTIEFENGTISTFENYAEVLDDFTGVTDGASFYQTFCTGPHLVAMPSDPNQPIIAPTPPPLPPTGKDPAFGYPVPEIISGDQQVSGYFLDGAAYDDVAVLSMLTFEPGFPVEFQSVIQTFIADAKAAGKTKIIIDMSSNGGGNILSGYDAFRQFFPQIVQDGFSRVRQHDAFKIMSTGVSRYAANFSTKSQNSEDFFAYSSLLNYRFDLNTTDHGFPTYDAKFAPHEYNGDEFTNLMRWNLNDPTTTTNPIWGMGATITGYGDRQNFTQPFASDDIILVYDGYCASTCTLFSDFMRVQGSVKSIALGGRPNTKPIQGVGGTRGANNYQWDYIRLLTNVTLDAATPDEKANWTKTITYSDLPQNRSTDTSINVRDNILRAHVDDGIPAQFLYETADCRLFYEPAMTTDVTSIWKKVADVAWGSSKCVAGSLPVRKETRKDRKRASEQMTFRARIESRQPVQRRAANFAMTANVQMLRSKQAVQGKKIPL